MKRLAMLVRHLLAIAILPFVVTVVVPRALLRRDQLSWSVSDSMPGMLLQVAGLIVLAIGLLLFAASLRRFAGEGEGTLAPWDPPRRLVVTGPYRYVRNPMISGVLIVLCGESLVLRSQSLATWTLTFFVLNSVYIPLFEEPQLANRFGASYVEYCRHVHRLVPRLRPWKPTA